MVDVAKPTRSSFRAIPIGAACGGLLLVIAVFAISGRTHMVCPAVLVGLAGSAIGCSVWVTRTRRHIPMPLVVISWSLSGGVVAFF